MKIPETSANVGAYYGNEENGQWQPNGVIVESAGAVGGGDARPLYPVHVPRNHIPGYVMAGAYYAGGGVAYAAHAPPAHDDFADYMWMEHEEEFDKQVMQQLEEEALMEQCIEAMLEDEQREARARRGNDTTSNGTSLSLEETVSRSTLNPLAAEFVPTFRPQPPADSTKEEKQVQPPAPPPAASAAPETPPADTDAAPKDSEDSKTEVETTKAPAEPPEVSAAAVTDPGRGPAPERERRKSDSGKKSTAKDKRRPQPPRSDTNIQQQQPKKKEVRVVKSESRVSESAADEAPADTKPTQPVEDPSIPKPINYAAAAKANKKKPPTPPSQPEKTPPPAPATEKPRKATEKPPTKSEKPIQRKNSAK